MRPLQKRRVPERVISEDELEMLTALYHLRYLNMTQLHQLWYPERNLSACSVRIARLTSSGYLLRTLYRVREGGAFSLGTEGLRALREYRGGHFQPTPELTAVWLPHHLATNAVFAALAQGSVPAWNSLPFVWNGTLNSAIRFEESRRDAYGVLRKRRALLRPDAIIDIGRSGPRIFLELDRSTEKLAEDDERRSIRRKLRAYSTVICRQRVDSEATWYQSAYGDGRRPRVVFVLEKADDAGNHRRIHAIEEGAQKIDDRIDVRCVYLRDVAGIRSACSVDATASRQHELRYEDHRGASTLDAADLHRLTNFYQLTVDDLRGRGSQNEPLRNAAVEAHAVLRRLHHGGNK